MQKPVKLYLYQQHVNPGRPQENTSSIIEHIQCARDMKCDIFVAPEMAVPGYLLGDVPWESDAFLRQCEQCTREIVEASCGIVVIFGNVLVGWSNIGEDGRVRKYNALFVAENGSLVRRVTKTLLPNYRGFDDSRHFYDTRKLASEIGVPVESLIEPVKLSNGLTLGCMLCEDGWDTDYCIDGTTPIAMFGHVDLFINISCSPYTFQKNAKRNSYVN